MQLQLVEIKQVETEKISHFLHYFALIGNTEYEHASQFDRVKFLFGRGRRFPGPLL